MRICVCTSWRQLSASQISTVFIFQKQQKRIAPHLNLNLFNLSRTTVVSSRSVCLPVSPALPHVWKLGAKSSKALFGPASFLPIFVYTVPASFLPPYLYLIWLWTVTHYNKSNRCSSFSAFDGVEDHYNRKEGALEVMLAPRYIGPNKFFASPFLSTVLIPCIYMLSTTSRRCLQCDSNSTSSGKVEEAGKTSL